MNLDGTSFYVAETAALGVVSCETRLELVQRGSRVFGRYHGGTIRRGRLMGRVTGAALQFRYVQQEASGAIHAGESTCWIERDANERLMLREHFTWRTREGSGTNLFIQIHDAS
jgi:hypothetical protein